MVGGAPNSPRTCNQSDGNGTNDRAAFHVHDGVAKHDGHALYDVDATYEMVFAGGTITGHVGRLYLHGPGIDEILAEETLTSSGVSSEVHWTLGDHQGTIRDPHGEKHDKRPLRQARGYQIRLQEECKRSGIGMKDLLRRSGPHERKFVFPSGHFAALSTIASEQMAGHDLCDLTPIFPPGKVLTGDELERWEALSPGEIAARIQDVLDPFWTFSRLTERQVAWLRAIIHPEIRLAAPGDPNRLAVLDFRRERHARSGRFGSPDHLGHCRQRQDGDPDRLGPPPGRLAAGNDETDGDDEANGEVEFGLVPIRPTSVARVRLRSRGSPRQSGTESSITPCHSEALRTIRRQGVS